MTKKVLLTGSTGFIGCAILSSLLKKGIEVDEISYSRDFLKTANDSADGFCAMSISVGVIIHCAARVHITQDHSLDPLAEFRKANVEGTLALARQAAVAGVKRFVFISSIKVNGEGTLLGCPYSAEDAPAPQDPYGISKMEAEQGLRALAQETGMEVVIIRPVLVYGPGVKANFRSMMGWLSRGVPLPLGSIPNQRSLVALDNLVDLIVTCIDHPAAANQTFLVSDDDDLSTSELLRRMGRALGKPARLLPVPAGWLQFGAGLLGKTAMAQRLCGSLQVDISKTRSLLGWSPVIGVDEALLKTAREFQRR